MCSVSSTTPQAVKGFVFTTELEETLVLFLVFYCDLTKDNGVSEQVEHILLKLDLLLQIKVKEGLTRKSYE